MDARSKIDAKDNRAFLAQPVAPTSCSPFRALDHTKEAAIARLTGVCPLQHYRWLWPTGLSISRLHQESGRSSLRCTLQTVARYVTTCSIG
jgi:hypothetical protein